MAAVQQQGAVQLALTPAATGFRPGETVTALLQASTSQPDGVELQEVEIELTGIERVDTSWVSPAYRREVPPINSDRRKVQRLILQSRLQAATQGAFSDSSLRRFVIRFVLPSWLPPTFRGTAVRYSYSLQARVTYRELAPGELAAVPAAALPEGEVMPEDLPSLQNGGDDEDEEGLQPQRPLQNGPATDSSAGSQPGALAASGTTAVTVRIPLHIWPLRPDGQAQQQQQQQHTAERASGLATSSSLPNGTNGTQQAAVSREEVLIKCWEIGPGTAVQDAISHIAKLAAVPAALRPTSPATRRAGSRLQQQQQRQAAQQAAEEQPGSQSPGSRQQLQGQQQQQPSLGLPPPPPALRRPSLSRAQIADAADGVLTPSQSQALDSSSSAVRSFALRIGEHPLVRVSLHPPMEGNMQPGTTVGVTLEFARQLPQQQPQLMEQHQRGSGGGEPDSAEAGAEPQAAGPAPRCVQVLVLLETEELVEQQWRPKGSIGIRRVLDEHSEVTADAACSHLLFTVPPDACPSFQTPLVQLRWLLRFQFTASTPAGSSSNLLKGSIEELSWALPLTVTCPRA